MVYYSLLHIGEHCKNRHVSLPLQCVGIVLWAGTKSDVYARQLTFKSKLPCCVTSENVDGGTVVADPIVRKLLFSIRLFRPTKELKVLGMVPDKRLLPMFKKFSLVNNPKELGIDPVKELRFNVKASSAVMAPIELGIDPVREFLFNDKMPNAVMTPIPLGIVPTRELLSTFK